MISLPYQFLKQEMFNYLRKLSLQREIRLETLFLKRSQFLFLRSLLLIRSNRTMSHNYLYKLKMLFQKKQTQQSQVHMPLRRSIREKRSATLDNYILFFHKNEVNIRMMEDDPINFCQALQSTNSPKLIDLMNEEMNSRITFGILSYCKMVQNLLVANEYLKLRWILQVT